MFASVLFGDVFRAFSPWRALGRAAAALATARCPAATPSGSGAGRPRPGCWSSRGSSCVGLGRAPAPLATAALGYTVLTLAAQVVYGVETWTRHGEAFSVYFNLFSRISLFETRDRVLGLRPPLAGLPRLDAVPGTVAAGRR